MKLHRISAALWATAEYLFYPSLMILATPFLVRNLGAGPFGLWMLVATVVGGWGTVNFGSSTMITRYLAMYQNETELGHIKQIIRFGLGRALIGGTLAGGSLMIAAPWLAKGLFQNMGDHELVTYSLMLAGFLLFLAQVEFTFKAALKGFELFGLAARLEVVCKLAAVLISLLIVKIGLGLIGVLTVALSFAIINCLVYGMALSKVIGCQIWKPQFSAPISGMSSFASWSYLQIFAGALFHQFDRFLIGAVLGAVPLAAYTICLQVAQQIHAMPTAIFSFLLPRLSKKNLPFDQAHDIVLIGILVSLVLGLPVIFFAPVILELWMGTSFAIEYETLLRLLAGSYLLLSISVVPHYLNLAQGHVQFISMLNVMGSFITLFLCLWLINDFGIDGVAGSKFAYGLVLLVAYMRLRGNKFDLAKN
jgi:O-antigen/teichoic acid export membrane protein